MKYLVSYDLNQASGRRRRDLESELESDDLAGEWVLNTQWVAESSKSAKGILSRLKEHLRAGDRVLIVRLPSLAGAIATRQIVGFGLPADLDIPNGP